MVQFSESTESTERAQRAQRAEMKLTNLSANLNFVEVDDPSAQVGACQESILLEHGVSHKQLQLFSCRVGLICAKLGFARTSGGYFFGP